MASPVRLSRPDVRRALVRHHFAPCATQMAAFERLRSVQFDPIAPVGCNHDLVLQARVEGYQIGDWEKTAYQDRAIYDGWDKQASLVPFEGWPLRRYFHQRAVRSAKILEDHPAATAAVLQDLEQRGPLMPKEFAFQEKKEAFKGSWYGASVTKQVLRALWHTGRVMTAGRRKGQHLYDLAERIVPARLFSEPMLSEEESLRGIALERHRAMGLLRPTAGYETWSYMYAPQRARAIKDLLDRAQIVPVEVEGMRAHATPEFLSLLDLPGLEPRLHFVAPLDQLVWDRGMVSHLFGFDYVWEIYTPEAKRRWGYYVLPVLFGDELLARAEFWCRGGVLELRRWHDEPGGPTASLIDALPAATRRFLTYCGANETRADASVPSKIKEALNLATKQ